tara:strand:+ start:207 stop:509 length:303 start_codon:yes stop_codon:yes gene_type:complete
MKKKSNILDINTKKTFEPVKFNISIRCDIDNLHKENGVVNNISGFIRYEIDNKKYIKIYEPNSLWMKATQRLFSKIHKDIEKKLLHFEITSNDYEIEIDE